MLLTILKTFGTLFVKRRCDHFFIHLYYRTGRENISIMEDLTIYDTKLSTVREMVCILSIVWNVLSFVDSLERDVFFTYFRRGIIRRLERS